MSVVVACGDAAIVAGRGARSPSGPETVPVAAVLPPLVETLDSEAVRASLEAQMAAMGGEDDLVPDTVDLPPTELRGVIESLLFVGTRPISVERLCRLLPGAQVSYIEGFLAGLAERYRRERRGWSLRAIGNGWQLLTNPDFHAWVRQIDRKELPSRLSRSAMETLAIIAYKQPVTRGEIEDIRGVQSGAMVRQLMDLKLVRVVDRAEDLLGRPMRYGTTEVFLDRFNLASVEDLPRGHELG